MILSGGVQIFLDFFCLFQIICYRNSNPHYRTTDEINETMSPIKSSKKVQQINQFMNKLEEKFNEENDNENNKVEQKISFSNNESKKTINKVSVPEKIENSDNVKVLDKTKYNNEQENRDIEVEDNDNKNNLKKEIEEKLDVEIKENVPKISNEISFYCISDNSVIKIMIKSQIKIGQSPNYECVINIFNTLQNMALTVLSKDKNIIFDSNSNIILYDDTFSKETSKILDQRLPGEYSKIENALTLDEDSLVFTIKKFNSIEPFIYSMKIDEENIYKINTNGLTPLPLFYMKAKKLLISFCFEYKYNNIKENNYFYICLINFACTKPEIIQMININYYDISKKVFYFNCFNDDSFYFPICQQTYNNEMFYKVIYISQYKLIKGEFREISRIKKEDDFSLKKYNSYGS